MKLVPDFRQVVDICAKDGASTFLTLAQRVG